MSDVNETLQRWRQDLEQTGGVSADDVSELESHLLQEMEILQKSGLRPDESFLVAARRLGHPYELANEYAKNDALALWRRPARLLLWGLIVLESLHTAIAVFWVALAATGLWSLIGSQLLGYWMWFDNIIDGGALVLLWLLVGRSQGWVAASLTRLEIAIRTPRGAFGLIAGVSSLVAFEVAVWSYLRFAIDSASSAAVQEHASMAGYFDFIQLAQLCLPRAGWFAAIAVILILLVRKEQPRPTVKLASR